jgi:hypothetical protein
MAIRKKASAARKPAAKRIKRKIVVRKASAAINYLTLSIGAKLPGGIFAGITYAAGKPFALVLGPEYDGPVDWDAVAAWVKTLRVDGCADFVLPSKLDGMLLFTNLRDQFKREAYWLEQHADYPSDAWSQYFCYGYQRSWDESNKLRARAVRRIPLSNSVL